MGQNRPLSTFLNDVDSARMVLPGATPLISCAIELTESSFSFWPSLEIHSCAFLDTAPFLNVYYIVL